MRKNKNRTLILSIASAAAVMPGCGDSSETSTSSDAATVMHPAGSVAVPRDDASDEGVDMGTSGTDAAPADAGDEQPRIPGIVVQPSDSGDEKPIMMGVMVEPSDSSFHGVMVMPQDGSAKG